MIKDVVIHSLMELPEVLRYPFIVLSGRVMGKPPGGDGPGAFYYEKESMWQLKLNTCLGCFWMKPVLYPKGGDHIGTEGARIRRTFWDERFDFDGTKLGKFPSRTPL
jgi:hypothetical protein